MFCLVALVVFSILGIFSAANRALAREALDCVLRRVTLRPCTTGFDEKIKARILGSVINRSETAARFLNRNFELLSWVFFILLTASGAWSVRGGYLFYTTGSCNGLNSSGFCVFDPSGANNQVSSNGFCSAKPKHESDVTLSGVNLKLLPVQKGSSGDQVVMVGCYHCDYTRQTYPIIQALVKRYKAEFRYVNFPTKEDTDYFSRLSTCVNQLAPDRYWQFNDRMFSGDKRQLDDAGAIEQIISDLGISPPTLAFCMDDPQVEQAVSKQLSEIQQTNFYGTPTVFINGKAFVGPKPYRVYAIALKGLLYWMW